MEYILYNISQVIGVTIIHSLWQALIVYLLLRLVLMILPGLSASVKYNIAIIALTSVTIWFIYTLFSEINVRNWIEIKNTHQPVLSFILGLPGESQPGAIYNARYYYTIEGLLPYITLLYILGLIFNTGKLIWARQKLNTLRKSLIPDIDLQLKVTSFADQLNISGKIQLGLSTMIDVPCVIGYFKPVILLPFTLSTYLSAEEIEIIILHELAHIKRNDYLVNLAQQTMSILIFFNPFAHLMERIINKERENSCDAIVVKSTQKPLVYAHALLKLEQKREHEWQLAVAATSKKYHLLNRIEQIMKPKKTIVNTRHILLTIILFTVSVISVAWLNPTIANGKISVRNIKPEIRKLVTAFTPQSRNISKADTIPVKPIKDFEKPRLVNADDTNVNANNYQLFGFGDLKMDSISAEERRYSKLIDDYFHNDAYETLSANARGFSKPQPRSYDNDTLKNIMTDLDHAVDYIKTHSTQNEDFKQRTELGKLVGAYYNGGDFKKLNSRLQKKYHIDPAFRYDLDDPAYQKYQAELNGKMPLDIKGRIAEIKKLSDKQREVLTSPEWGNNIKRMKLLMDSMKAYYKMPHVTQHQDNGTPDIPRDEIRKYSDQLQAYLNNPEIKRYTDIMREDAKKISDYMSTPEFQKHVQDWKNNLRTTLGTNNYDEIVHPGRGLDDNK